MNVDGFTLFIILMLIAWTGVFCTGFLWISNRSVPGIKYWFYSQILYAIATPLTMARAIFDDVFPIFLASLLFFLSLVVFAYGHIEFLRQKQPKAFYYVLGTYNFIFLYYFCFFDFNTNARVTVFSITAIISSAYISGQYWRLCRYNFQVDYLFAIIVFTVSILIHSARLLTNNTTGALDLFESFSESPVLYICLFWAQLVQLFVLFSLVNSIHVKKLSHLANHDPLTNSLNRRSFMDIARKLFLRQKENDRPLALLMIDVDWFKSINDKFGHQFGDEALRSLVLTIKQEIRPTDMLGRYGGEEFCVLLEGTTENVAIDIAERIRQAVEDKSVVMGHLKINMSISIGFSMLDNNMANFSDMLERSDKALYKAKENGRNRICFVAA